LQISSQIEDLASRHTELRRIPADPHDKAGLAAAVGHKPLQDRHAGMIAIADPDPAAQRGATFKRLGGVLAGQFQMREPAAAKIKHRLHAPVRAGAAGFADTRAVSAAPRAAGPAQMPAGHLRRQQPSGQGGQECHRLLQAVINAAIAEIGELQQRPPACCLAQRKPAALLRGLTGAPSGWRVRSRVAALVSATRASAVTAIACLPLDGPAETQPHGRGREIAADHRVKRQCLPPGAPVSERSA
jgi:hypothetical protein